VGPAGEKLVFGSVSATAIAPVDSVPAFLQCIDSTATWRPTGPCGLWSVDVGSTVPVQFRVLNADTLPLPNVTVRFSTWASVPDSSSHAGTVVPQQATTDTAGSVTVMWTVDTLPGLYALEAELDRPDGTRLIQSVFVHARIPTPIPGVLQCLDTTATWRFGGACAYPPQPVQSSFPVTFRVVDADTVPQPGASVLFHVDTTVSGLGYQDGSVIPDSGLTDSLGTITAQWTLGRYPGTNRLVATSVLPGMARAVGVTVQGLGNAPDSTIVAWTNPAGGSWHDPTNWDLGRIPGPLDTALITLPGRFTVSATDSVLVHGLVLGAPDSSTRTLAFDRTVFQLDGAGVVDIGGVLAVTGGATHGVTGQILVRGGEVRLSDAAWRLHTRLENGALIFEGTTPNLWGAPALVATGGDVIWRSADTLLLFADSTSLALRGSTFTFETPAVFVPTAAFPATAWLGDLRFLADSAAATSLTLYGMNANVNGTVHIVETLTPPPGTIYDLIRLENGATLSGLPTMGTSGYTLQLNPQAGVGLRATKN
jgi:hypothetical protein